MMSLPPAWRRALPVFAIGLLALLGLYAATAASIVEIWNRSETFAHGYVVMPISLWLIWRRRADLVGLTPQAEPLWLALLVPLGLLWLLGDFVAANAVVQFAFTFMLILLVPLLLGREVAGRIAFPLGFLLFGVPFGDFLTPVLMEHTADFAVLAVRASGIPVYREGLSFVIPSGSWSVVQACSGIRYLMASVMVGTLFAYLNYNSTRKRWIFVGVSIVTPIIANWLRAYMIVMLGHLSGNRLAVGVDHLIYGWVFFGVIMFAMFMIGARWTDPEPEVVPPPPASAASASPSRLWGTLAATLLVLGLPLVLRGEAGAHVTSTPPTLHLPPLAGWAPQPGGQPDWKPDFEAPADSLRTWLRNERGERVGLYVGYYRQQGPHSKLVTSTNLLVNSEINKVWSEVSHDRRSVELEAQALEFRTAELRGENLSALTSDATTPRLRVWQIYWITGRPMSSDWRAKIFGAWQRLMGQGDDAAVLILYTPKADGADALLQRFVQQHWQTLDTWMRGVREQGRSH